VKDLTNMEMLILKKLHYKTLYTTSYDFLIFYLDFIEYLFNSQKYFLENTKNYALYLMKQNINTNLFISQSQSNYAFLCLQQALMQMGQSDVMEKIMNFLESDDLIRMKREENDFNKNNERNYFTRNLEVNLFSLSSF
jgi:hypothetical protein